MKKLFIAAAALAVLASCNNTKGTSQTETTPSGGTDVYASVDEANAPKFKFERETYDFGEISQGEKVSYDFKFTNTGKSPLIVSNTTATCGCTVPEPPKEPIAPGATGIIHVVFDSAGKLGLQNKVITITANTVPATTEVHLVGNVKEVKAN